MTDDKRLLDTYISFIGLVLGDFFKHSLDLLIWREFIHGGKSLRKPTESENHVKQTHR